MAPPASEAEALRQHALERFAAWLWDPAVPRLRSIALPARYRGEPMKRVPLEVVSPNVAPGESVLHAIPPGWFMVDTIQIVEEVARAFELRSIEVGNLAQTMPERSVPAIACTPDAPLRLLDWCPPEPPIVMKISNVSSKPAAFSCLLVGDLLQS